MCADYAAGRKVGGTQWEIAEKHSVSLVLEGIAHLPHGIPNRWTNPREVASLKFDQDDIAEHWRTVQGQEPPQGR